MNLEEVRDKVYFVEGMNSGKYPYSNSLLIEDDQVMLIDTGTGPEVVNEIAQEKKVNILINSHGHEDHIGGNYLFPSATICAHQFDAPAIRSTEKLKELYDVTDSELEKEMDVFLEDMFSLRNSRVDMEFEDGKMFNLGNVKLEVLHTPGHSAGHCCFYIPKMKLIFLSDIDLSSFGPWYGCLDSNITDLINSIHRIKSLDFETAISSHKGIIEGKEEVDERLDKYLEKIYERENMLWELLHEEKNLEEIVEEAIIYGSFPEPQGMYRLMEKTMIIKHLGKLVEENKINRTHRGFTHT